MGTTAAFDTHKFVKDLTATGIKTEQAEVLADYYASLFNDHIATKNDLKIMARDLWIKMFLITGGWSSFVIAVLTYTQQ